MPIASASDAYSFPYLLSSSTPNQGLVPSSSTSCMLISKYYVAMNDNSSESTFDEEADERKAHSNVSKKESRPIIKGTTAESRSPQPGSSEPSPQRRPPQDQPQVNHHDHKSPPWSESCPMNQHDAKPRARPYPDMSMGTSSLAVPPSNAVVCFASPSLDSLMSIFKDTCGNGN